MTLMTIADTPHSIALGSAIGIFFGFTPLWSLKTLLSIAVAWIFKCNKIAAAIAVTLHDIILPLMPAIYFWQYRIGMDREVMLLRDSLIPRYSALVYNGYWFSPEREALQAFVTETQRDVTGLVRLKLYKGNIIVGGRKSPKSLYDPNIASMEGVRSTYNQSDATGFIRLNALRLKMRALRKDA